MDFKKNWPYLIGLILTLSLLWPLFSAPLFSRHDDVEIIRLYEMDQCFKDGQIPCRWVPNLGGMYGYPLFNYYAPLPYYFGELIFTITGSLINSVKVMYIVSFVGAYIFMYLFSRYFWGSLGASLAAIFYSFAPYHALDFYVRGAMGEMWGLMAFPALLWSFTRLYNRLSILNLLLSGLFVAILVTSHNLSAMIFLPILIIWIVFLFLKEKKIKFIYYSFVSLILGVLLSSFYLLPVIFEKNLVHVDTTTVGYFYYTEHFKGIKRLLERSWGYGPSVRVVPGGEKDALSYQVGWIHLLGWFLSLVAAYKIRKSHKNSAKIIVLFSCLLLFTIFMINPRSQFIWDAIEPLKYLQFPWRFLMLVSLLISFVVGGIFVWLSDNKKVWWVLVILVVFFNFSYFKPEKFIQISEQQLLSGENLKKQLMRSVYDYLPKSASEPPANPANKRYEVLTGDSKVFDYQEGSNWFKFKTETNTHSIIRISQYYFPDWKIFVDGKQAQFEYKNNSLGLMTLILGEGNHTIEARLYDTPIRFVSNIITAITGFVMLVLFMTQFKKVKAWVGYYRKRIN